MTGRDDLTARLRKPVPVTDWPDDLIDALAARLYGHPWGRLSELQKRVRRGEAMVVLAALREWCDGDLFDPATGQRIVRTEVARMGWEPYDDEEDIPCPQWRGGYAAIDDDQPLWTLTERTD